MVPGRVSFLIVGSPRSGTTLVQRLACELPGVVVPFETHFFTKGIAGVTETGGFPLGARALREALDRYAELPALEGADLDVPAIVDRLGGQARDALELFDAVVATAAGPHEVLGEKTPGHVDWVDRLCALRPELRVIGVVRDPRAVIVSRREVPWGGSSAEAQATRWLDAQRRLDAIASTRAERSLILRYEDVVTEPRSARTAIADLIGVEAIDAEPSSPPPSLGLAWEHWKDRGGEDITDQRIEHWRDELRAAEAARITRICAPMLERFGYVAHDGFAARVVARVGRRGTSRRRVAERRIRRQRHFIASVDLGPRADDTGATAAPDRP